MKKLLRVLSAALCVALVSTAFPVEAVLFAVAEETEWVSSYDEYDTITVDEESAELPETTEAPSVSETPSATVEPTPEMSESPTAEPTVTPGPDPSVGPSAEPVITPSAAPSKNPDVEGTLEPTQEPTQQPTMEPSSEPEPTVEPTPEPPVIDYSGDAGESLAFIEGYAELLSGESIAYADADEDAEEYAQLGRGVVYVIDRSSSGPDRLRIAFNPSPEKEILTAWVDAKNLRPMNPAAGEEVERYIAAAGRDENTRFYDENKSLPLRVIPCAFIKVEISLNKSSAIIGEDDSGLDLDVIFSDGKTYDVRFESSKPKYAKVDAKSGVVTGLRTGSAIITAYTQFGELECELTIKKEPRKISVKPVNAELGVGEQGKLAVSFASSSYGGSCRFESSDPAVATVDGDGVVTGVSKGTAVISVTVYSLPKKPVQVTVSVLGPATKLSFDENAINMNQGMETELKPVFLPGERDSLSYSSDNETVATVFPDGTIHARSEGTAKITAVTPGGVSAVCTVHVLPAPSEADIVLLSSSCKLGLKESFNMMELLEVADETHAQFSFASSKEKYVSVDADGNVKGLKKGSATIRATTQNGIIRDLKVEVCENPKSVSFEEETIIIGVGSSADTRLEFKRSGAYSRCTFASSDEGIVVVDEKGVVTGVAAGTATVTVETLNGKSASCRVIVKAAPESIGVAEEIISLGLGEPGRKVVGTHDPDSMCSFSYTSMDEGVVRVNSVTGELSTVAEGSAEIIVTSNNGVTAACEVRVLKAPTRLTLNESSIRIAEGERYTGLTAIVEEGAASGLTLSSSKTKYVKIEDGAIVGLREGTSVITARTYNGLSASCKVTVCGAPKSISFPEEKMSIGAMDSAKLHVSFKPDDSYSPISYSSSDADVAYVEPETGMLMAVSEGDAVITAKTLNGKKAFVKVSVKKAPESISALEDEIQVGVGEEGRFVVGVAPEGSLCSFRYESLNPEILSVDAVSGALAALAPGRAEIRITAHNGVSMDCAVRVMAAPEMLTLSHDRLSIIVGERYTDLHGIMNEGAFSELKLTSSKPKYVKIEDGEIVGLRIGTAIVTATTYNGLRASCKVTVTAAPTSIFFEEDSLVLGRGESAQTHVGFRPAATAGRLSFSSDAPEIATVDPETGMVQGLSVGTATITATSLNGLTDQCKVRVSPAPESLCFENAAMELSVGMSIKPVVLMDEGAAGTVLFESSDPTIARVEADGVIHAVGEGGAEITARSYNGITAVCALEVSPEPALAYYDFDRLVMVKGDTLRLPVPITEDKNGNSCPAAYSYESSRSSVVSVSADGEVKALRNGTVEITVTTHNGLEAYIDLVVSDEIPPLKITPEKIELYTDGEGFAQTVQLSCEGDTRLIFESSRPDVASVDARGVVTAVSMGSTMISVRAANGSYVTVEARVHMLSSSISLGMDSVRMGVGEVLQLEPVLDPGLTAEISYVTDNPDVIQVDENGLLKAMAAGKATVTASLISGKHAMLTIEVLPGPTGMEFGFGMMRLSAGEETALRPLLSGTEGFWERLRYESDNHAAVTVDESGVVRAVAPGQAVITAESCNGLTDRCVIEVLDEGAENILSFTADAYSIVCGDSAELPIILNKKAYERGYSVASSDPELLQIEGSMLRAHSLRSGEAVLTLSLNPNPALPDESEISVSCTVSVVSGASVELEWEELELTKGESASLMARLHPENLIGSFGFEIANPEMASYDMESGMLTAGMTVGETFIRFYTFNGSAICRIVISSGTQYRALIIGEYNDSGEDRALPFADNNLYTMKNTLGHSNVEGEGYEITTAFNNPSKGTIRSLLLNTFADADEDDVSLIYIMSHGYYGSAANGYYGYHFSIAPNYDKNRPSTYITSDELMLALRSIPGRVILVLDSCKSGGFIRDQKGELEDCGNIAVFTAQSYDKGASFYVGRNETSTVEFFTYAFCYGLGVQQLNNYLSQMPADSDDDGFITVDEAFGYARRETKRLIADKIDTYKKGSKYGFIVPGDLNDEWSQNPQKYIPGAMEDLVFYAREAEEPSEA